MSTTTAREAAQALALDMVSGRARSDYLVAVMATVLMVVATVVAVLALMVI
jgi:hypothetical protein